MNKSTVLARMGELLEQFTTENTGGEEYTSAKKRVLTTIGLEKKKIKAEIHKLLDGIEYSDFLDRQATSKAGADIILRLTKIEKLKGKLEAFQLIHSIL